MLLNQRQIALQRFQENDDRLRQRHALLFQVAPQPSNASSPDGVASQPFQEPWPSVAQCQSLNEPAHLRIREHLAPQIIQESSNPQDQTARTLNFLVAPSQQSIPDLIASLPMVPQDDILRTTPVLDGLLQYQFPDQSASQPLQEPKKLFDEI